MSVPIFTEIAKLSDEHLNRYIVLRGRIHKIRIKKNIIFLIIRDQNFSIQSFILKKNTGEEILNIAVESIVDCYGHIKLSPVKIESTTHHNLELELDKMEIVSKSESLSFQIEDANELQEEDRYRSKVGHLTKLESQWLNLRTPLNVCIFKIQSAVTQYFREYLLKKGFIEIHSPKIIGSASEGGAEVFRLEYFQKEAFLAQSPQLYKQLAINSDFKKVFEVGPVFRAENSNTKRHLCEFTGLDFETEIQQGKTYKEIQSLIWNLLLYIFEKIKENWNGEIEYIKSKTSFEYPSYPENPLIVSFSECVRLLKEAGKEQKDFEDFTSENERKIGEIIKEKYNSDLVIIEKYPRSVRPFYTMVNGEDERYTNSWDVVFKGTEISSGSQRENNYDTLLRRVKEKGVDPQILKYYLNSFSNGSPPHGGTGFGLERLVSLYLNLGNVKFASFCPRDPKTLFP